MSAYEDVGGVRGAVARLAETAYERLDPQGRVVARTIFLRLAGEGEGVAAVRRRVPLGEFDGERDAGAAAVLAALADDRLVTIDEGEVEVAHEALLREWPRLRGWLEEDAEGRRLHYHLRAAARDWDAGGRDPGELYRGARLATTLEWIAGHEPEVNDLEREFVGESRAAMEVGAERQRRVNQRLRALLASVAVLLALAVVAGAVALSQRGEARDAALVADAQRLGAEALSDDRLDHALLLARAGVDLHDSAATRGNLLSVLQRSPAALGVVRGDGWPLYAVAVSPDERLMAIGDERGTVTIYDRATRRPLGRYRFAAGSSSPACASRPTGRRSPFPVWIPGTAGRRLWTSSIRSPGSGGCGSSRLASPRRRTTSWRTPRSCRTGATWRSRSFTMHPTRTGRRRSCAGSTDEPESSRGGPFGWADTQRPACPRPPIGGACS